MQFGSGFTTCRSTAIRLPPPFAASYYNWTFYGCYGAVTGAALDLFHLSSESLPLLCRLVTLLFAFGVAVVSYHLIRTGSPAPRTFLPAAFGLLIAFNPLTGYWIMTTRPDVGGLLFELIALDLIQLALDRDRENLIWAAIPFFYLAWAFKQTNVTALAASCICLWINSRRRWFAILTTATAALFTLTLAAGGEVYRYSILQTNLGMDHALTQSLRLFGLSIVEFRLFAAGIGVLVTRRQYRDLMPLASLVALAFALATSSKDLASDNYFLPAAAFAGGVLGREVCPTGFRRLAQVSLLLLGAAAIIPFSGIRGSTTAVPFGQLRLLQPSLDSIGKRAVVTQREGNLPWFQRREPFFVYCARYSSYRAAGLDFQRDGIGGMIRAGEIEVVACPKEDCDEFDGARLGGLPILKEDAYWRYLSAKQGPLADAADAAWSRIDFLAVIRDHAGRPVTTLRAAQIQISDGSVPRPVLSAARDNSRLEIIRLDNLQSLYKEAHLAIARRFADSSPRKVLVISGRHRDTISEARRLELVFIALRLHVTVFAIGAADPTMVKLAEDTGGRLARDLPDVQRDLDAQVRIVASTLPHQEGIGQYHRLELRLPAGLRAQAPRAYYITPPWDED